MKLYDYFSNVFKSVFGNSPEGSDEKTANDESHRSVLEDVVDGTKKENSITDEDIERIITKSIEVYEKSNKVKNPRKENVEEYENKMDEDFSEFKEKSEERVNAILNKEEHLVGLNELEKAGSIRSWNTTFDEDENEYRVVIRFFDGNKLNISLKNRMIRFDSEFKNKKSRVADSDNKKSGHKETKSE